MTFADSLRKARDLLQEMPCRQYRCSELCLRCQTIAELPDPEDVEGLEKASPTYWLELGKAMGMMVRKNGELREALLEIATQDYRGNEHPSAAIARTALDGDPLP